MIDTLQLKFSIITAGLSGKLTVQNMDDLAAKLIAEVQDEKNQLIKKGFLKKDRKKDLVNPFDFEIPRNWVWTRIGDVSTFGLDLKKVKINAEINGQLLIDLEDIERDTGKIISYRYVDEQQYGNSRTIFTEGSILYPKLRPYLRKILIAPTDGVCTDEIIPFKGLYGMESAYLFFVMRSKEIDSYVNSTTYGMKMPRASLDIIRNILIPLPPLEEQKRIVAKIEELFAKIDEIDKAQKELKELAELAEKKVLDMAVRGELVEQDESEGSGRLELNAIKSHLTNNNLLDKKRLRLLETVEQPFPVPSTWVWTKIGFITNYTDKKEKVTKRIHLPTKLVDMENIVKDTGEFIDVANVTDISNLTDRVVFHRSDVLYGRLRPYLRKIAVAKYDGICSPEIVPFRGYFHVDSEYLCAVMRSEYISSAVNLAMHGVNMPRASKELIQNLCVPLPPYPEQARIAKMVNKYIENLRSLN